MIFTLLTVAGWFCYVDSSNVSNGSSLSKATPEASVSGTTSDAGNAPDDANTPSDFAECFRGSSLNAVCSAGFLIMLAALLVLDAFSSSGVRGGCNLWVQAADLPFTMMLDVQFSGIGVSVRCLTPITLQHAAQCLTMQVLPACLCMTVQHKLSPASCQHRQNSLVASQRHWFAHSSSPQGFANTLTWKPSFDICAEKRFALSCCEWSTDSTLRCTGTGSRLVVLHQARHRLLDMVNCKEYPQRCTLC